MKQLRSQKRIHSLASILLVLTLMVWDTIPAFAADITPDKISQIAASVCGSSVTVTWENISGADGYEVQRRLGTTGTYETIGISDQCSYADDGLTLDTVYYYRVRSYALTENGTAYSSYCNGKYVKTDYLEKLEAFSVSSGKTGNVISWQEVNGADGYILYYMDKNGGLTKITQTAALSYTDTSVSEGESYCYCARAYKVVNGSYKFGGYSDPVSIVASTIKELAVPTILSAYANGRSVTVNWNAIDGADGYLLQRKTGIDGNYTTILDVTNETSFQDTDLSLDTVYYYRICAYAYELDGSVIYGSYCNGKYVKTTYLETIASLQGTVLTTGIQLDWEAVSGADGYIVYYVDSEGALTKAGQTVSAAFTDNSVLAGEVYTYCVRAYAIVDDAYKYGGYSEPLEIGAPPLETYYDVTAFGADGTDMLSDNGAIQAALNMALKLGDQELTVYIPAGTYYLDKCLIIYSNTTLSLDAACTLVRNDTSQLMLTAGSKSGQASGGYTHFTDIKIEGGVWDGNASTNSEIRSIMYLYHGQNLFLSNFTVKNCCGGHHIELAGVKNATVSEVVFRDFIYSDSNDYSDVQPETFHNSNISKAVESSSNDSRQDNGVSAEALQLDYCSSETAGGSMPYDNTACEDIIVEKCTFFNVLNGVGNHHGDAIAVNITIQNNTFENIANNCINLDATDGFLVSDNSALEVRAFLYILSSRGSVQSNVVSGCTDGTKRSGNMVTLGLFSSGSDAAPLPDVLIQDNTFSNAGAAAIRLKQDVTATIENNIVSESQTMGIYLEACTSVTMNGNTITGSGESGIYLKDTPIANIIQNQVSGSAASNILIENSTATLKENTIESAWNNGLAILNASEVSMSKNTVFGNGGSGISSKMSKLQLTGDRIYKNSGHGVYLEDTLEGTYIHMCEISTNTLAGIACTSGSVNISGGRIYENTGNGVWLFTGGGAEISGTELSANSENGVSILSSSICSIENCSITDNIKSGVNVNNSSANIYNSFIVRNGSDDTEYDVVFKTGSSGTASGNVTGKKSIYVYPTALEEVTLVDNRITIAYDYEVAGVEPSYYYDGTAICPAVSIQDLKENLDYTVYYENNDSPGTAAIVITGIGDYTGEIRISFEIFASDLPALEVHYTLKSGNTVCLEWNVFPKYDGYYIMKKVDNANFAVVGQTESGLWEETVSYGETYTYRIQGFVVENGAQYYGSYSNQISVTANLSASTVSVLNVGQKAMTITWEEIPGAEGYEIQRKENIDGTYETIAHVTDAIILSDNGLEAYTVYYYRVRAYAANLDGSVYYGAYSAGKYTKTNYLEQTKNLKAESSKDGILLTWNPVEGATGYMIYDAANTSAKMAMTGGTSYTDTTLKAGESRSYTVRAYFVLNGSYKYGGFAETVTATASQVEAAVPAIENGNRLSSYATGKGTITSYLETTWNLLTIWRGRANKRCTKAILLTEKTAIIF